MKSGVPTAMFGYLEVEMLRGESSPAAVSQSGDFHSCCACLTRRFAPHRETTDMLAPCARSVKLFHKGMPRFSFLTHYVGDVRIHNAAILDRYMLKSLDGLYNLRDLEKLTPTPSTGSFESLVAAHTGIETQEAPPDIDAEECAALENLFFGLLDNVTVVYAGGFTTGRDGIINATFKKRFPELGSWWRDKEEDAAPRKWYAGSAMHGADYRISAGGFVHGFRYSIRAQVRHILQEQFDRSWPVITFELYEEAVEYANQRVQEAAGIYQMQDVLVDILAVNVNGTFSYYEEVPKWWMTDIFPRVERLGLITVEFKYTNKDVWNLETIADSSRNDRNPGIFLHPVVSLFWEGEIVPGMEFHLPEDAEGTWRGNNNLVELSFALHKAREQLLALVATGKAMSNAQLQTATVLRKRCTESGLIESEMLTRLFNRNIIRRKHYLPCEDVHSVAQRLTRPTILNSIYSALKFAVRYLSNLFFGCGDAVCASYTDDAYSIDGTLRCSDLRQFAPPMLAHLNALNNSVAAGHYSTAILLAKQIATCEELDEGGPINAMVSGKGEEAPGDYMWVLSHVYSHTFNFQGIFSQFEEVSTMTDEGRKGLEKLVSDVAMRAVKVKNPLEPRLDLEL